MTRGPVLALPQAGGGGGDEDEDAVQIGRTLVLSLRCLLSGTRIRTQSEG